MSLFLVFILLIVALAGCAGAGSAAGPQSTSTAASTPTSAPTATSVPTATVTHLPLGTITCPTILSPDGSTKIFSEPQLGFSFTYPAAWTEKICQQGSNGVLIGNLFSVSVSPQQGRTIAQMVDATKTPEETVTLTPVPDPHAVEVVQVGVTFPNRAGPTPEAFQPFVKTIAIVAGTQSFYTITGLIAQQNMTDTIDPLPGVQLAQQIVSTFTVS
jgi:hypothetical protein